MRKKLLYIHELSSSSNSMVVANLHKYLDDHLDIIAEDIPLGYAEAIEKINELNRQHKPDIVLGISMGGMFAHQIDAPVRILVNPAFHVSDIMQKNIGVWRWSWKRNDLQEYFEITQDLVDKYRAEEAHQFDNSIFLTQNITVALFADNDELVDCLDEYRLYYNDYRRFCGTHFINENNIKNDIAPLIKDLI